MDKIKVEKVVDVFCDNLNVTNVRYRDIIKELMINIISHYEKCGVTEVEDRQQYLIKNDDNKYTIEDFFLNRLLFNVTSFEVKDSGGRADYSDYQRKITINRNKISTLLDKYSNLSFTDEQKFLAAKKVIMHEFEHALQTKFEYGPYINDCEHYKSLYNRLLNANLNIPLNQIYDGRRLFEYIGNGRRIESGLIGSNDFDEYKKYTGTFYINSNDNNYISENNINEIYNESEALVMSKSNQNLSISFPSNNNINIRNIESSNFLIANYGFMLKMLLGNKRTFEGMYLERNKIINYFNDNFETIFRDVFEVHLKQKFPNVQIQDGWSILNMVIGEAKYSYENGAKEYSDACHLKLNYAFSLCLEKIMKKNLENGMSFEASEKMLDEFTGFSLYNIDPEKMKLLPHAQILKNLRENIEAKFELDNNYETFNSNCHIR